MQWLELGLLYLCSWDDNSQKVDPAQVSINIWMNKQNDGISIKCSIIQLLKEGSPETRYNINAP